MAKKIKKGIDTERKSCGEERGKLGDSDEVQKGGDKKFHKGKKGVQKWKIVRFSTLFDNKMAKNIKKGVDTEKKSCGEERGELGASDEVQKEGDKKFHEGKKGA